MKNVALIITVLVTTLLSLQGISNAQVIRGEGEQDIAGALWDGNIYDEFTFHSPGNVILFAVIQSDLYQTTGRRTEEHEVLSGEACSEGGPGGFCLQLWDNDELLCWADRPVRPGWDRGPKLACPFSKDTTGQSYKLRVFWRPHGENPCAVTKADYGYPGEELHPYLLEIRVRKMSP